MRRRVLLPGVFFALSTALWAISATVANPVRQYLNLGRADDALQALDAALDQNPADANALNLRCRVFYQEELWDKAISDCEAAVRLAPGDSNYHLWLGRAYGQRAAHSSLVAGYKLARNVHREFEEAVRLDPRNAAALADLGEFDVSAPGVVGGGVARAEALLPQIQSVDPAGARTLQARIAEAKRNYPAAEADYKAAITQSSDPADAWMDLAAFYRRRGRLDEMVAAAHTGASLDRYHGPALVDGATNLARAGREPQTAIQWLRQYLSSHAQSEVAPAFAVRAQLAKLLLDQGDSQGAQEQIAAARALASGYRIPSSIVPVRGGQ